MKLKIIIISIFILSYSLFIYQNTKTKNERINLILNEEIKNLQTHYNLTMGYFIQDVSSIRENMKNNKKIINIFSKAKNANREQRGVLRDKLFKLLTPMYKTIKSRGILQWQFVFPNNVSFLRMHKPNKYGDDLTNIRNSYKLVNKVKETIIGFEQGRTTHAFRYVFPYYDNQGNHLGAIEISLASYALQEKLLNVNKIHSHFLVNKKIFKVKAWEEKYLIQKYMQSIEHNDYMYALTKNSNKKRLIQSEKNIILPLRDEIDKNISTYKSFALYTNTQDTSKVITFVPIENTKKNKVVAYIVSYSNNNSIYNILQDYNKSNIIIFVGFMLLFYFIYKNLKHKEELKDINESLEQLVNEEIVKNKHKEDLLAKQSKMAALGEMMDAIAHQWKQPLGVIGMNIQRLAILIEFGQKVSDEDIKQTSITTQKQIKHLTSTIDEFRNFFRPNQKQTIVVIKDMIDSTLLLMKDDLLSNKINIKVLDDEKLKTSCIPSEFKHIFINLINNAKDAFNENNIKNRNIIFEILKDDGKSIVKVSDNAGGIPSNIIDNIFNLNFTTKEIGKGTGIGLYLTKQIIEKLNATIEVVNQTNINNNEQYSGTEFLITLPN